MVSSHHDEKCTYFNLIYHSHPTEYLCKVAAVKTCEHRQEFFNFFELYWCTFSGNSVLFIIFFFFLIIFIFKFTSLAVEKCIARGIKYIASALSMPESITAVTLIAFANGAGDIITAFVASKTGGGVSYNIGALYGSCLFTFCIVVSLCIFQSEEGIILEPSTVYRDIGLYIVATIFTLFLAYQETIKVWGALCLFSLYIILIGLVLIEESIKKTNVTKNIDPEEVKDEEKKKFLVKEESESEGSDLFLNESVLSRKLTSTLIKIEKNKKKLEEEDVEEEGDDDSIIDFLNYYLGTLIIFIIFMTSPSCSIEGYSKKRCVLFPIAAGILYSFTALGTMNVHILSICIPTSIVISLILYFMLKNDQPPSWQLVLSIICVISGLVWTYQLITIIVDILNVIGIIFNLSETYLGLTVLAIGNVLPDALTILSLNKQGLATMAISGAYAGQLFGYLVGFGIALLKMIHERGGSVQFRLLDPSRFMHNLEDLTVISISLLVMVYTLLYSMHNSFKLDRPYAFGLVSIYIIFIVSASILSIHHSYSMPEYYAEY